MQIARVIGDIVSTHKDPALQGVTLLVIQPLTPEGDDLGRPIVAVDAVGAGVSERVFFVRGKEASFPFHPIEVPADAGIVGIIDHWTMEGATSEGATSAGTKEGATSVAPARRP